MATVNIRVLGKDAVAIQADNYDCIYNYMLKCGFDQEVANGVASWSLSHDIGDVYEDACFTLHITRGNVETMDYRTMEWIPSPPEMESFLAEIDDVCKKHGMSFATDSNGEIIPLLVQKYSKGNMSLILGAKKDYDLATIKKQPASSKSLKKWEYQSIFLSLYERPVDAPKDITTAVLKIFPNGEEHYTMWWQKELETILNEYGACGWEVVTISDALLRGEEDEGYLILKREVEI